jgi:hypothetical protein
VNATIIESIDYDNVWVFWKVSITFYETKLFKVRAVDILGNIQKEKDIAYYDGLSEWPVLNIEVV